MQAEGEGFTVVCSGFEAKEAAMAADSLHAAGVDARVIDSEDEDYSAMAGDAFGRCDVIVPSEQAAQAMALLGITPQPDPPPPYTPSPLVAALPLLLFGAFLLLGSIVVGIDMARKDGFSGTVLAIVAPFGLVGLLLIFGTGVRLRFPPPRQPPRSRIVS